VSPRASMRRVRVLVPATLAAGAGLLMLAPSGIAHAEPTPQAIERQIRTESAKLEQVVEEYNRINEELGATKAAADKVTADLGPLTQQLSEASDRLARFAAYAYAGGQLVEMSSILDAGDPSTLVDRMATINQIAVFSDAEIAAFTDAKTRHDGEAAKLQALIADQTAKQKSLADQKSKIDTDLKRLYELRRQAYGRAQAARPTGPAPTPPQVSGRAGIAVQFAYGALGTPYQWAGSGPDGYDCSGLTQAAWRAAGVSLPHNAAMQYNALPKISRSALSPGDLVFYNSLGHVGIYVGNGQIIHSPHAGDYVHLASVDVMRPYGYARPG
jgi:cell wall-associated NlpC family hydrolase